MSALEASAEPKSIKLNSDRKVQGIISPWHHSDPLNIPLKAGMSGTQLPDGTCHLACRDGKHTVVTTQLPPEVFASA